MKHTASAQTVAHRRPLPALLLVALAGVALLGGCSLFGQKTGTIAVDSSTTGAAVYVDGVRQTTETSAGETLFETVVGDHEVLVFKSGLAPHLESITVAEDSKTTVSFSGTAGTVLLDDEFESDSDVGEYANDSVTVSHETSGGNSFLRVANLANPYAVFDWPITATPQDDFVYSVECLGHSGSGIAVYVLGDAGLYGVDDRTFLFYLGQGTDYIYEPIESSLPGVPQNRSSTLTMIGVGNRLLFLQDSELIINYTDERGVVSTVSSFQAEVLGFPGDTAGTNSADFDDLLIYGF